MQELILHMIQLDPTARLTSWECLTRFTPSIFPHYFSKTLTPFFGSLLFEDADTKLAMLKSQFKILKEQIQNPLAEESYPYESDQDQQSIQQRNSSAVSKDDVTCPPESVYGCPYVTADPSGDELIDKIEDLGKKISQVMDTLADIDSTSAQAGSSPRLAPTATLSAWVKPAIVRTDVKKVGCNHVFVSDPLLGQGGATGSRRGKE